MDYYKYFKTFLRSSVPQSTEQESVELKSSEPQLAEQAGEIIFAKLPRGYKTKVKRGKGVSRLKSVKEGRLLKSVEEGKLLKSVREERLLKKYPGLKKF